MNGPTPGRERPVRREAPPAQESEGDTPAPDDRGVPDGYVVNHHVPTAFLVSCASCGQSSPVRVRPGAGERRCSDCDHALGITPISEDYNADPDASVLPRVAHLSFVGGPS